ncbi:MAG TPA: UDP-N-acetylglucosamine 2-epimerase (non-hydrolyzing) [Caldisericia bacterium]|nr:UDP-N-acetylglucosamine 2-epimerase (non-hydrolyzing) [Caldisericia bacterium]
MSKPSVFICFGTRPEAIKMAPVVHAFLSDPDIETKVILTAQHREMLDQVMELFKLPCHYDFNIMAPRQTLSFITQSVLERFSELLLQEKPSMVLVHGDTSTTFACALASFYQGIPVAHVEAGLRSGDMQNPFPEEMNRKLADALCTYFFPPTYLASQNLQKEAISGKQVMVTGNTVVDALQMVLNKQTSIPAQSPLPTMDPSLKTILMTMHRRESWGEPMLQVSEAVRDILLAFPNTQLLFPVHKNPIVRELVQKVFHDLPRVHLIEALDYYHFVQAMKSSYLIISDSGGIQEEAPSLGKPVLLTRKVTERPEGIQSGIVQLAGTNYSQVYDALKNLIQNHQLYSSMQSIANPFGDGKASQRIVRFVRHQLGLPVSSWNQESEEFRA